VTIDIIFTLLGGLGLFFLGMRTMSDSLRRVASEGFRSALDVITRHPILGLLIGTAVTALVQSSSATTVMTVGFVNAGLLNLRQAISIVLGANIGTTLTAWLVSFMAVFKITRYSLPAIGLGMFLTLLGRTQKVRRWGQFLLGFGLLFTGLGFIKDAFGPLQDQGFLKTVLVHFGSMPILGILLGMAVTVILQSSSATIALLQLLAFTGVIDFGTAIPIILGENIGTTITAELSAIGATLNARRTARSHALLNIFGVCYMIVPVYLGWYERLIDWIMPGPITQGNIMLHIALAHTTFNVINCFVVFLPSIRLLERAAIALTPRRRGAEELEPKFLEKHLLDTPALAIQQAIKELIRMAGIAREALQVSIRAFFQYEPSLEEQIRKKEAAIDMLQKEITQYLVETSERNLDPSDAETLPVLLHSVNDVERIGDHAENIIELAMRRQEQKLELTAQSLEELHGMADAVDAMAGDILLTLSKRDADAARRVLASETRLNELQVALKESHVARLQAQECHILSGLVYVSLVDNLEKIGDHLTNIAMASLRRLRWDLEPEIEESEKRDAG
jgi:phosphate:Na+ symporter